MALIKLTQQGFEIADELMDSISHIHDELGIDHIDILQLAESRDLFKRNRDTRDNVSLLRLMFLLSDDLVDRSRQMEEGSPKFLPVEYDRVRQYLKEHAIEELLGADLLEIDLVDDVWDIIVDIFDWQIFRKEYFMENRDSLMNELNQDDLQEIITMHHDHKETINFILQKFQIT